MYILSKYHVIYKYTCLYKQIYLYNKYTDNKYVVK